MAFTRKVLIKKKNLKTKYFFTCLWKTFISLTKIYNCFGVMFDLFSERSINFTKHKGRTTTEGIETTIAGLGRLQKEGDAICSSLINQIVSAETLLECTQKEAEILKCEKVLQCCNRISQCIYFCWSQI